METLRALSVCTVPYWFNEVPKSAIVFTRCIAKPQFIENAQSNFCFLQKHFVWRIKSAINNTHGFLLVLMVWFYSNGTQHRFVQHKSLRWFLSLDEHKFSKHSCLKDAGSVCLPRAPELSSLCTACAEVSPIWPAAYSHRAHTLSFLNAYKSHLQKPRTAVARKTPMSHQKKKKKKKLMADFKAALSYFRTT